MFNKSLMVGIVSLTVFLGCAGGGPKLSDEAKLKINKSTKYNVASVEVNLRTLVSSNEVKQAFYPDEPEVALMIKKKYGRIF